MIFCSDTIMHSNDILICSDGAVRYYDDKILQSGNEEMYSGDKAKYSGDHKTIF